MPAKASLRFVRIAPRKARMVIDLIRGKHVDNALAVLESSTRGAAKDIKKLLNSALANAENNENLNVDRLYVSEAFVNEGPTIKRWRPRAMGRATRINKRTSHITIVLDETRG